MKQYKRLHCCNLIQYLLKACYKYSWKAIKFVFVFLVFNHTKFVYKGIC